MGWLNFLVGLPVAGAAPLRLEQFNLSHMPCGMAPKSEFAAQRLHWAQMLNLSPDQLAEGEPSKRRPGEDNKGLLHVALKSPEQLTRAWEAARKKRGDIQRRERIGSVALNVAAYAVLLQAVVSEKGPKEQGTLDESLCVPTDLIGGSVP